ncbi:meteorin-like, partial [Penaeus indicus]|uniref:meteorin-like n=1 Tax=Penaeus indicus TaxID=29960 RepID=UPI00300CDCE5
SLILLALIAITKKWVFIDEKLLFGGITKPGSLGGQPLQQLENARITIWQHRVYIGSGSKPRDKFRRNEKSWYHSEPRPIVNTRLNVISINSNHCERNDSTFGSDFSAAKECRPCSEDEILRLYCSGDFVARGSIERVEDDHDLATTTITIRASKLFQQTSPVFRHAHAHGSDAKTWESAYGISNSIRGGGVAEYTGRVDVPIQCGARAGEGEFLVMGVMRLGKPILRCAPRHAEWVKIAKAARANAQCVLET